VGYFDDGPFGTDKSAGQPASQSIQPFVHGLPTQTHRPRYVRHLQQGYACMHFVRTMPHTMGISWLLQCHFRYVLNHKWPIRACRPSLICRLKTGCSFFSRMLCRNVGPTRRVPLVTSWSVDRPTCYRPVARARLVASDVVACWSLCGWSSCGAGGSCLASEDLAGSGQRLVVCCTPIWDAIAAWHGELLTGRTYMRRLNVDVAVYSRLGLWLSVMFYSCMFILCVHLLG